MLLFELRTAWRSLRARPAFSGLVVGVLAIGLGCVLHVAGMINGLIVEPLPIHSPEQLFDAGLIDNDAPPNAHRFDALRTDELLGWREYAGSVAAIAGVGRRTINLSDGERPERYAGAAITANLLPVLGVQPALGRGFADAGELPGAEPVAILSDRVWRERYLGDPQIVGRQIRVNARPARIVGVMPPDFSYPYLEDVWVPATLAREPSGERFAMVLRPKEGVAIEQVRVALDA
jgi:putative ABC transport system permease protein